MALKRLRAEVSEEAYGIFARVEAAEYRSDTVATGYQITERLRERGRRCCLEVEDDVIVRIPLGDAPDSEFDMAADDMLEAASW